MTRCVVDASVAVKWLVQEEHSLAASRLLEPRYSRLAPDLLLPEMGNILWKMRRRGEIDRAAGLGLLQEILHLPVVLRPSQDYLEAAYEIAVQFDRTMYDGLYVALAVTQNCRLVTADKRLSRALENTRLAGNLCWIEDVA